jgi:hypothetical protein
LLTAFGEQGPDVQMSRWFEYKTLSIRLGLWEHPIVNCIWGGRGHIQHEKELKLALASYKVDISCNDVLQSRDKVCIMSGVTQNILIENRRMNVSVMWSGVPTGGWLHCKSIFTHVWMSCIICIILPSRRKSSQHITR